MHRLAAVLGAAAVTAVVLAWTPAAVADEGHDTHPTPSESAPWPEWAEVEDPGHEDGHDAGAADGHEGHGTPEPAAEPEEPSGHEGHGGEDSHEEPGTPQERPRGLVLGSFAALNGGVLAAAAIWRRRTRGEVLRRRSARSEASRPRPAGRPGPGGDDR